jgi:hypothetical protein
MITMKTETEDLESGQSHGFFGDDLVVGIADHDWPNHAIDIIVGSPGSADRSEKLKVGQMTRYARADNSALYEIRLRSVDGFGTGRLSCSFQVIQFDDPALIATIRARTGWEVGQ